MKLTPAKIVYIIVALCAFVLGMKQLREPDIWWQLLAGRWMLDNGSITRTDIFSYTMQGSQWINVKWLYEVIIALFEKVMGPEVVILLQAIVNVVIVWLLFKTSKAIAEYSKNTYNILAVAIAVMVFLAISEYRMAGRPEMVSHLMATLYVFILWRNPSFEFKRILWLVPLQCLWSNMHEAYPVGIVIIGATTAGSLLSYLITRDKQKLQQTGRIVSVFVLAILVILCNPNGMVLWNQPFEIYRQVWANKYTTELYSYADSQYWTIQAKWHIAVLLFVMAYLLSNIIQAIRNKSVKNFFTPITASYLILTPLFAYLSLTANRNIPFAQIILIPMLPVALKWLIDVTGVGNLAVIKSIKDKSALITIAIAGTFYLAIVTNNFYSYTGSPNKYGIHVNMLHNPTGAASFIKQHNVNGLAFSDYFISSYLLWHSFPSFKSYIDLRDLDVFPADFFDDYFKLYQQPGRFDSIDKKYNFSYVVLSTSQLAGLQFNLYWGEAYNLVYVDPVSAIFLKNNEQNKRINDNKQIQKLFNWPAAIEEPSWASILNYTLNPLVSYDDENEAMQGVCASRFYNGVKNYKLSVNLLKQATIAFPDNADMNIAFGQTYLQYSNAVKSADERSQKTDSALMYLQRAMEMDDSKKEVYSALGSLYATKGDYELAAENISVYIEKDKSNYYMYYLLGFCNRMLWKAGDDDRLKDVIKNMKSSIRLNPQNGAAHLYIAEAYAEDAHNDNARKYLKEAEVSGNSWTQQEQELFNKLKQQLGI